MTFASKEIIYPLELSQFIDEPASYVVLDILTPGPLDAKQLPKGFTAEKTGRMEFRRQAYRATRITAKLAAKERHPDLRLKVTGTKD
jgi:hypothetical protein